MTHLSTGVTLNVDLGEHPNEPEELYRLATVVNIACGGHAGDEASMERAATLASRAGIAIAAHPSYPDREGFGRKTMAIDRQDLINEIASQCARLASIVEQIPVFGGSSDKLRAVKLHGALYHDAATDPEIASAVMEGAARGLRTQAVIWIGPPNGALVERARSLGLEYRREGFADRGMRPDGSLIARTEPGALIEDPDRAAEQALALAASGRIDTLCVHSDTPGAVQIARAVRAALERASLLALNGPASNGGNESDSGAR